MPADVFHGKVTEACHASSFQLALKAPCSRDSTSSSRPSLLVWPPPPEEIAVVGFSRGRNSGRFGFRHSLSFETLSANKKNNQQSTGHSEQPLSSYTRERKWQAMQEERSKKRKESDADPNQRSRGVPRKVTKDPHLNATNRWAPSPACCATSSKVAGPNLSTCRSGRMNLRKNLANGLLLLEGTLFWAN